MKKRRSVLVVQCVARWELPILSGNATAPENIKRPGRGWGEKKWVHEQDSPRWEKLGETR